MSTFLSSQQQTAQTMETFFFFTFMSLFILWISWLHQITDLSLRMIQVSRITFILARSPPIHPIESQTRRGKIGEKKQCLIVKCRIQWNNDFTSHKSRTGKRHFSFILCVRLTHILLGSFHPLSPNPSLNWFSSWNMRYTRVRERETHETTTQCEYWKYTTEEH